MGGEAGQVRSSTSYFIHEMAMKKGNLHEKVYMKSVSCTIIKCE